jgi:transcriptional regulator with XRE-family HTH domain
MVKTNDTHPLRKWRKSKGLTQGECATAIGTTKHVWCDWERGRRRPGPALMPRLRDYTGCSADIFYPDTQEGAA